MPFLFTKKKKTHLETLKDFLVVVYEFTIMKGFPSVVDFFFLLLVLPGGILCIRCKHMETIDRGNQ